MHLTNHNAVLRVALVVAAAAFLAVASSPIAAASASRAGATAGSLSGTWSGTYGGAYRGTFVVHWRQTGSQLRGTIKLSNPKTEPGITGSVHGSRIRFGTVGSAAITYSGSVSGKSMSGTYHTPKGGGSWSARRTS